MKQRLDFLATTPNVVKAMLGLHKPLSQSGLENASLRSTVVHSVWICTPKIYEQPAKPSNDFTCSKRGARARSIRSVNVRHLHGQKLSRHSVTRMFPTTST